ncbi:MAG: hypothetical protein WDW38_001618 [Sanguina aurantia]
MLASKPSEAAASVIEVPAANVAASAPAVTPAAALPSAPRLALSRFFCEYYIFNAIILSTYALLRWRFQDSPLPTAFGVRLYEVNDFNMFERHASLTCIAMMIWHSSKARCLDAAVSSVTSYSQLFVLGMAFAANKALFLYYGLAFLTVFLLFAEPIHAKFAAAWEEMLPDRFNRIVAGLDPDSADVTWVVLFYAPFSSVFRQLSAPLTEIASRYKTSNLRFVRIDVGEFNALATKIGIEVAGRSVQMPTVALYEKGTELARMPSRSGSGNKWQGKDFTKQDVVAKFELDMRFARAMASGSETRRVAGPVGRNVVSVEESKKGK